MVVERKESKESPSFVQLAFICFRGGPRIMPVVGLPPIRTDFLEDLEKGQGPIRTNLFFFLKRPGPSVDENSFESWYP